ncbi:hypothetical protein [Mesorhizobium xinjiangense]|uniref:hypothetical protein n=1 Tax=Mesorhizobium xinjiangense TaxID=2678685 RepID=UPI0012ED305A|nr:hypothetical protein [Mesorhizobium xinjiangense]
MFTRAIHSVLAAGALAASVSAPGVAADKDHHFFRAVEGEWTGPGEIVAGKYKGTRFTCRLVGDSADDKTGMALDGTCRVGVFSQKMSAVIERAGDSYRGTFLDGAEGKGLDIVSGSVDKHQVVMGLNRNKLNGAMLASMKGPDTMNVTVSVRVEDELVPVIGVNLKRVDTTAVGAIARD